ncbi:MAG: hypothetical protein QW641_03280, partial [Candidatus Aenigmatarchaeota archaeon]
FTVAVAAIIGTFLTGLTRTTVGGVERGTAGQAECAGVYIDVLTYNSSANGKAVFRNPSNNEIRVISALNDAGQTTDLDVLIKPGQINTTTVQIGANNKITFTGFCLTTTGQSISITGECSKGQSCWTS